MFPRNKSTRPVGGMDKWLHPDNDHPRAWLAPLIQEGAAFFGTVDAAAMAPIAEVKYLCLDSNAELRERMNEEPDFRDSVHKIATRVVKRLREAGQLEEEDDPTRDLEKRLSRSIRKELAKPRDTPAEPPAAEEPEPASEPVPSAEDEPPVKEEMSDPTVAAHDTARANQALQDASQKMLMALGRKKAAWKAKPSDLPHVAKEVARMTEEWSVELVNGRAG